MRRRDHQRRKHWTKIDEIIFRQFYPNYSNVALAHYFGRSVSSITQKASLLGLRKSESFATAKKREFAASGKKHRFAKPPTNKENPIGCRMNRKENDSEMIANNITGFIFGVQTNTAKVEVDYLKATNSGDTGFIEPELSNGITPIRRHQLK